MRSPLEEFHFQLLVAFHKDNSLFFRRLVIFADISLLTFLKKKWSLADYEWLLSSCIRTFLTNARTNSFRLQDARRERYFFVNFRPSNSRSLIANKIACTKSENVTLTTPIRYQETLKERTFQDDRIYYLVNFPFSHFNQLFFHLPTTAEK